MEKIYDACDSLIGVSRAECFGLLLIEAAQHKLAIIARDTPVFREVPGERAFYFSGNDAEVLSSTITQWFSLNSGGKVPQSDSMPWLTWKQSADQLKEAILNHD